MKVGKMNATTTELREAARRAQALTFIGVNRFYYIFYSYSYMFNEDNQSNGFDTDIGERGRGLSGLHEKLSSIILSI